MRSARYLPFGFCRRHFDFAPACRFGAVLGASLLLGVMLSVACGLATASDIIINAGQGAAARGDFGGLVGEIYFPPNTTISAEFRGHLT